LTGPALVTTALYAGLLLACVLICRGEVSSLLCADSNRIGQQPLEKVRVGFHPPGFDGQFYYALARDPWRRHDTFIDFPCYRHGRILYLALAWLFSGGGDAERLLWVLPAINLAAFAGLGLLGAMLATHHGRSPWWGVFLTLAVNVGVTGMRDLTDPVATLAAVGLVAGWLLRWRPWVLAVWAVAAVLGREQNVAIVLILLLETLIARRWRAAAALSAGVLVCAGWICLLREVYGVWPFADHNTGVPFAGILYRLRHMTGRFGTPDSPTHLVGMCLLLAQIGLSGYVLYFRPGRLVGLVCLGGVVLAVIGGRGIYIDLESYTRVFWWMPFGVWLWTMQSGRRWPALVLSCALVLPLGALWQTWGLVRVGTVVFAG
jgi:hypothetical protein